MAEELDRTKSFPYEIVKKLGELGLMGIPYPEEYGGGGADTCPTRSRWRSSRAWTRAWRSRSPPTRRSAPGRSYAFGSEEQKQEWMPQLTSGEKLGAFGLTEPEAGSDAGNARTTREAATTASG